MMSSSPKIGILKPTKRPFGSLPRDTQGGKARMMEAFVQALPYDYTFLQDGNGRFLYCSPQFQKLGFHEGDMAFKGSVLDQEAEEQAEKQLQIKCQSVMETSCPIQMNLRVRLPENPKSRIEKWSIHLFPVLDPETEETIGVGGLVQAQVLAHVHEQTSHVKSPPRSLAAAPPSEEVPFNCLRAMNDASEAASVLLNSQGLILECNKQFISQKCGTSSSTQEDDIRGKNLWELSPPWSKDSSDSHLQELQDTVKQVISNGNEIKFQPDGLATEHSEFRVTPAVVEEGQVQAIMIEAWQESNCSQEGSKLRRKESLDDDIFHHLPTAYAKHEIVFDEKGKPCDYRFLKVNKHFEDMTGLSAETTVGKCVTEVLPGIENDPANWIGRSIRVACEGQIDRFSRYSENLKKWYSGISYSPSKNQFVTFFLDITEQKETEEALRQSEEQHRNLFETMKQGVSYLNADGKYAEANPSALKALGLTMDQFLGRTAMDPRWNTIHEDGSDWPSEDHPINRVLKTGEPISNFVMGVFNTNDEKYRWLSIDCMPRFRSGEDKPYQACAVFTDITETKEVEQALLHAKEKAEEADKLKSSFLATMSHELRTPLNGIMGNLDLVLSSGLDETQKEENLEGLRVAMQSGQLLISLIGDILDLSKIEAGQIDISQTPFSISAVIAQTMQLARAYQLQRKKEHIEIRHEVGILPADVFCGDEFRLQQILNNLLSNAIKFTDEGFVSLAVGYSDNNMWFSVKDTGKGIPEEKRGVIFHPFRQVELSDTREHGGTGLGLTICHKLIDLMGGSLRVESNVSGES